MAMNPTDEDQKPTIEERYSGAIHASNLRVQAERTGPADVLIAAGMSPSRLGAALMRLHSEWDAVEHPKRPTTEMTQAVYKALTPARIPLVVSPERYRALELEDEQQRRASAAITTNKWYVHELGLLFQKLKTLPEVRRGLSFWVREYGIADADKRTAEVLSWWLHNICPACSGRKKEVIAGTPSLSHKDCRVCKGTGKTRVPHDANNTRQLIESWKILRHIDVCVKSAEASLKSRLHPMRDRKEKATA